MKVSKKDIWGSWNCFTLKKKKKLKGSSHAHALTAPYGNKPYLPESQQYWNYAHTNAYIV